MNSVYDLKYEELVKYIKNIIEGKIELESTKDIIDILLLMTLNDINYELADKLCYKFFYSSDYWVKRMAIIGVGHIARVYHKLVNEEYYQQILNIYQDKKNPYWENAHDALSDIKIYLKIQIPKRSVIRKSFS